MRSFSIFGNISIVSSSVLLIGGLTGFFFGVPQIAQQKSKENDRDVFFNTNLVQISDWLTKILVGVGLIQLQKIINFLYKFIQQIAPSFTPVNQATENSISITIAIVIYYSVCGFFLGYIWANLYYTPSLKDIVLEKKIEAVSTEQETILAIRRIIGLIPVATIDNIDYGEFVDKNKSIEIYQALSDKANNLLSKLNNKNSDIPKNLDTLFEQILQTINTNDGNFAFLRPMDYFNFSQLLYFKKTAESNALALKFLDKAIEVNPYQYDYLKFKGILLREIEKYSEAITVFEELKNLKSDKSYANNNLGVCKFHLYFREKENLSGKAQYNKLIEIIHLFDKAISRNPYKPLYYANRGFANFQLGRYEDALEDYEEAIKMDDELSLAWYNKACYYATARVNENVPYDSQKAIYFLRKAIEINSYWKTNAIKDDDFKLIKDKDEFIRLVNQT